MAKRRSASGGWQTPGTRVFLVQVQWFRAPQLDREVILARIRQAIASTRTPARVSWEQTAFTADADDVEDPTQPFTDLFIEATDAAAVWAVLLSLLDDPDVGPGLRRSSIIICDAPGRKPGVPAEQLRLHHFDPSELLDEFR